MIAIMTGDLFSEATNVWENFLLAGDFTHVLWV